MEQAKQTPRESTEREVDTQRQAMTSALTSALEVNDPELYDAISADLLSLIVSYVPFCKLGQS